MGKTTIEWTDLSWAPIRGCSRTSDGCTNCYAERIAARFSGPGRPFEGFARMGPNGPRWTGEVRMVPEHLEDPLRWKKPQRIFLSSMSDIFHEKLVDADIDQIFAVMLLAPQHTFQCLTKRPARMQRYLSNPDLYERVLEAAHVLRVKRPRLNEIGISNPAMFPAKWIWLGVTAEDQQRADERLPLLIATPAAVRFVSVEPQLEAVDLSQWLPPIGPCVPGRPGQAMIDQVICGAESGPGARPWNEAWARLLRDQCSAAGVAFFLKQKLDERGHKMSLPMLDGRQHVEQPR